MPEYATWIALIGAGGSLVIVLGWVGRQLKGLIEIGKIVALGIEKVPLIEPFHAEAMSAIHALGTKVDVVGGRLDVIDDRLTLIDARAVVVKADLRIETDKVHDELAARILQSATAPPNREVFP